MDRELSLEVVRVTETAALASAPWMGRGDKHAADGAATKAMRMMFDSVSIKGTIVIGEGEMDEAPMLYIGEKVGNGEGMEVDVAVDPLEGTENLAKGLDNSLSVIAMAPKGKLLHAPDMYMYKLAVGPELAGRFSLDQPLDQIVREAARILNKKVSDFTVMILDRERHRQEIELLRSIGARIKLLSNGDVAGAIATAFPESGIDMYVGAGGAPEGVLAAAALKCLGGEMQGRLKPENEQQYERCVNMGLKDPSKILSMNELVGDSDIIFAATGITNGDFLKGVRYLSHNKVITHSMVMRAKTRTIRFVESIHYLPGKPYLKDILADADFSSV
jgi:fructose-1,6-bisphosphatase II